MEWIVETIHVMTKANRIDIVHYKHAQLKMNERIQRTTKK